MLTQFSRRQWFIAGVTLVLLLNTAAAVQTENSKTDDSKAREKTSESLTDEQKKLNLESFDHVWTTIRDRYWDEDLGGVDWNEIKEELRPKVAHARTMDEARGVIGDMMSRLEVSHFSVVPADAYQDMETKRGRGTTGIDARIIQQKAFVTEVIPGSSAQELGVRTGWEIIRIGDINVVDKLESISKTLQKHPHLRTILVDAIQSRLRSKIGDPISVVFCDQDDHEVSLKLVCRERRGRRVKFGHIPEFYVWMDVKTVHENVGYIRFNAFMDPAHLMPKFNQAVKLFMTADGLIVDVRGNGGGMGEMGSGMIGWFIDGPPAHIGTAIFREQKLKMIAYPRPKTFDGPVAVLIDEMSISAAEYFAAGMKDTGAGHLIGTRTAGAALGSSVERLPNGDGFQYAQANFVSNKTGRMIEGIGITPDLEIAPTRRDLLNGTDTALQAAIDWIQQQNRSNF